MRPQNSIRLIIVISSNVVERTLIEAKAVPQSGGGCNRAPVPFSGWHGDKQRRHATQKLWMNPNARVDRREQE
jgi:hypothetical protein